MRHLPVTALGLVVGGSIFGSLSCVKAQGPAAAPPSEVGRYQITPAENSGVWLVDTATGETWFNAGQTWEQKGKPTGGRH